jgi:hypothetical protein
MASAASPQTKPEPEHAEAPPANDNVDEFLKSVEDLERNLKGCWMKTQWQISGSKCRTRRRLAYSNHGDSTF